MPTSTITFRETGSSIKVTPVDEVSLEARAASLATRSIKTTSKKIIAIGDNLRTDIKGAINMNYDSLFITGGIHSKEIEEEGIKNVLNKYNVKTTYYQSKLKW